MKKNKYLLAIILLFMINSAACQKSSVSVPIDMESQTELLSSFGKSDNTSEINTIQETTSKLYELQRQEDKVFDGKLPKEEYEYYNENKLFGNSGFEISDIEIDGVIYQRLYNGEIELLSKDNGSNTTLNYNNKTIELPFDCTFNLIDCLLKLEVGDYTHKGGKQLSLNVTIATGTGVLIQKMHVIDLNTMAEIPVYDFSTEKYNELTQKVQIEAVSLENSKLRMKTKSNGENKEGLFHSKYETMDQALTQNEDYTKLIFGSHVYYSWDKNNNLTGDFLGWIETQKEPYRGIPLGELHIVYEYDGLGFIPTNQYWFELDSDVEN